MPSAPKRIHESPETVFDYIDAAYKGEELPKYCPGDRISKQTTKDHLNPGSKKIDLGVVVSVLQDPRTKDFHYIIGSRPDPRRKGEFMDNVPLLHSDITTCSSRGELYNYLFGKGELDEKLLRKYPTLKLSKPRRKLFAVT